ncbi:spore coat protein YsxE [Bacillus salitolerans]|uniref:Spore coat protein YsxE n=1 Tax=Bacillus salitolerans TaxID=1437434 RepID=A0ABW4LLM5_9BACI
MTTELLQQYQPLLREYGIEPQFIEDLGRVKKIHSTDGILALKQAKLPYNEIAHYERKLQFLQYKSYGYSVPVYRTKTGSFFVFDNHYSAYYLMPWLDSYNDEEERNDHAFQLFKQLGELHANSLKEERLKDGEVDELVDWIKDHWQKRRDELELFIEKCEENTYMSPFQLYYCTYFQEMMRAQEFALRKLDDWKEMMDEKKKYRTVFIHGQPSFHHFLYNVEGQGLFVNFERSGYSSPIHDLLYFFYRSCKTYPLHTDDRFQWFQTYRSHFPLQEDEVTLFMAYLAYPENMYRVVKEYQSKSSKSELKSLQLLQRSYWQMKNIEYFLTNIVVFEEEKKKKEQQESQES